MSREDLIELVGSAVTLAGIAAITLLILAL